MKKFLVILSEVSYYEEKVEAETKEEAIEIAYQNKMGGEAWQNYSGIELESVEEVKE